ncbi:MAG: 23S rRNA (guanosine(2251)-2'-O)-methyltransferase RlmB [Oscillospiraceae bacterium]|nr:23S rRNA (guanosine(2251)-2'-O)-methyltransferase RlmB [Oscillospiraceae bacterium]
MLEQMSQKDNQLIFGRNAVLEAIKAGTAVDKLFVAPTERKGSLGRIISMAKEAGIPVKDVTVQKLDAMTGNQAHQGVAATIAAAAYASMEEIWESARKKGEKLFLIVADEIEDPHNLGALIRTAECCGAHGIVVPKRRSAGLSPTVYKSSAGAVSHFPVVRVSNLVSFVDEMKDKGVWFYCADMDGQTWCQTDFGGHVALVIGSEGSGVGRLLKEKCDFTVSLPMQGRINSLNASVAGGVLMYEIARQRLAIQAR